MTPRMKVFLKLKGQEVGAAILVVAVLVGIIWGGSKLNTIHNEWVNSYEYSYVAENISGVVYFLNHPMCYLLDYPYNNRGINRSFYCATPNNLYIHAVWTILQWASVLGVIALALAILYGLVLLVQYWIKCNWKKAGLITGDIKPRKRKRK